MISQNQPSWSIMPSRSRSSSTTSTPSSSPSKHQTTNLPQPSQSNSSNNNSRFRHHDSTFSVSDEYSYYNHTVTLSTRTFNNASNDMGSSQSSHQRPRKDPAKPTASKGGAAIPNLNVWQGAALITADNMGTGLLALPQDIAVLGLGFGLGFLIANLPINLYAGSLLCESARYVEQEQSLVDKTNNNLGGDDDDDDDHDNVVHEENTALLTSKSSNGTTSASASSSASKSGGRYSSMQVTVDEEGGNDPDNDIHSLTEIGDSYHNYDDDDDLDDLPVPVNPGTSAQTPPRTTTSTATATIHHDTATFDFIGMTSALFYNPPPQSAAAATTTTTRQGTAQQQQQQQHHHHRRQHHQLIRHDDPTFWVMMLFYTNIFLVLGNYIVVMAHAVSALVGEDLLCIPAAGLLASTLMFAVSQLRTMARLGRAASIVSLSALAIVVGQCLYFCRLAQQHQHRREEGEDADESDGMDDLLHPATGLEDDSPSPSAFFPPKIASILLKLSAMGSIGFAVGSQKLLLNIRHEFQDRSEAPTSLAMSLFVFGACYVLIILAAGPNPPGFLFDAIPEGTTDRRIAGFLLWIHVVVSYAINSQAICSSMDRIFFYDWIPIQHWSERRRWMMITFITSASAFFVANAIPFFKDLVAFIGALTSVPLTLLLPAIYERKVLGMPIWWPGFDLSWQNVGSYLLLVYSVVFMVTALAGSVYSILSDWQNHTGGFFACR